MKVFLSQHKEITSVKNFTHSLTVRQRPAAEAENQLSAIRIFHPVSRIQCPKTQPYNQYFVDDSEEENRDAYC